MTETKTRSILKSLSWRAMATICTILLVLVLTGEIHLAISAGLIEVVLKLILFYAHERIWLKVPFGTEQDAEKAPAVVLWLTGLSGAGKSTIAKILIQHFKSQGERVQWLDGDVTREFIPATGFSREERDRHVLSTGFTARLLEQNGVNVVASYISPFRETRAKVRAMCKNFMEIHLSTPLELCEQRDVKGLYQKARAGEIKDFTGLDSPYEPPDSPELRVTTEGRTPEEVAQEILDKMRRRYGTNDAS